MKKILIYAPMAVFSPHFETDLEIAMREISKGNKVSILPCKTKMNYSCTEQFRDQNSCLVCKSRFSNGVKLLPKEVEILSWKNAVPSVYDDFGFETLDDFNNYKYKDVEVGQFIISTFISIFREPKLDFLKHRVKLENSLKEVIKLIDDFLLTIDFSQFDVCYLFNGRFSILYPVLRLFQLHGKKFYVHECAGTLGYFSLSYGTYPHDLKYKKREIQETCTGVSEIDLKQLGQEWFFERRGRSKEEPLPSFLTNQVKALLPNGFNSNKRNISIFVSSEDEFESINGWENPLFSNQNEGIRYILQNLNLQDFRVYVRIHPNLKDVFNSQTEGFRLMEAEFKNVYFVGANAEVDTYALLEKSEKVISFGSTVGIEAACWGTPSILVGRALYEHLDVCYIPKSKDDLIFLIKAKLEPKGKSGCFKYGYWIKKHGIKYKYFRPDSHFSGYFLNHKIKPSFISRLLYKCFSYARAYMKKGTQ